MLSAIVNNSYSITTFYVAPLRGKGRHKIAYKSDNKGCFGSGRGSSGVPYSFCACSEIGASGDLSPNPDLVGVLQVLLQTGRFKIPSQLKLGPVLQSEMLNFRVTIDPRTAHDSYSAWREAGHDDLVLSVALACWYAETAASKPMPRLVFPSAPKTPSSWRAALYPYSSGYPTWGH